MSSHQKRAFEETGMETRRGGEREAGETERVVKEYTFQSLRKRRRSIAGSQALIILMKEFEDASAIKILAS